jgi:hypothetical protein
MILLFSYWAASAWTLRTLAEPSDQTIVAVRSSNVALEKFHSKKNLRQHQVMKNNFAAFENNICNIQNQHLQYRESNIAVRRNNIHNIETSRYD